MFCCSSAGPTAKTVIKCSESEQGTQTSSLSTPSAEKNIFPGKIFGLSEVDFYTSQQQDMILRGNKALVKMDRLAKSLFAVRTT